MMRHEYLSTILQMENARWHFLEALRIELETLHCRDINNIQALMLFNIGGAEMTVGELLLRGRFHGSNPSYNVKKMVENGYLRQVRSASDRRAFEIRLTDKGVGAPSAAPRGKAASC